MDSSPISITRHGVTRSFGLDLVCSGYLVHQGKVLLVHHNGFHKWVPPGGHIEPDETFAQTACREFREETGLVVRARSSSDFSFNDDNARTEPLPFHVDVLIEGFARPTLTQYFYVELVEDAVTDLVPQLAEVQEAAWFGADDLAAMPTFEQVRALCSFALLNHPSASNHGGDTVQA